MSEEFTVRPLTSTAHATLAFDGDRAGAWCEYGTPEELPNIHHRKQYDAESEGLPDYRLTCIFIDKASRRKGISAIALRASPTCGPRARATR